MRSNVPAPVLILRSSGEGGHYSLLSARTGSIRVARLDTITHGTIAETSSVTATADSAGTLVDATWNNCDSMPRRSAIAPSTPITRPKATSFSPCPSHELMDVGGRRAEGDAHANLALPLGDEARDDAVNAERSDAESDDRECSDEPQQ